MDFMGFPPELRLSIAEVMDPRDCYHLARTCRNNHGLLRSLLATHESLHRRYSTLDANNAGRLIWEVTKDAIENPKIARHIKDISLPGTRQKNWHIRSEPRPSSRAVVPVDLYVNTAKQIPILRDVVDEFCDLDASFHDWDWTWTASAEIGWDLSIVTLLLAMAMNLETLRFEVSSGSPDELEDFVRRISLAYQDPDNSLSLPFQHLTTVAMTLTDSSRTGFSPRWTVCFLRIPTLRRLACWGMGGTLDQYDDPTSADDDFIRNTFHFSEEQAKQSPDYRRSEVEELCFFNSYVHHATMQHIISSTKALKRFTYDSYVINRNGDFAPRAAALELVKYAADSLEELVIVCDHYFYDHFSSQASLREFKKLKKLRCPWNFLVDTGKEQHGCGFVGAPLVDLAKFLPPSLEVLHFGQGDEDDYDTLEYLVMQKETALPNLKKICFDELPPSLREDDFIERLLPEKGIEYFQCDESCINPLRKLLYPEIVII
ncbi:hypothetical protein DM02DRAFT_671586 [Periconia macrospinosa]|uniref:F-box domain-containing protein n=1 Tax=Periconia macrospinosa TaxID=97972 RepID=A0A2V1DS78_9PLEO|nr:hypothetical protein DM02DRAFT_671586 [Periconia macrospinosa]